MILKIYGSLDLMSAFVIFLCSLDLIGIKLPILIMLYLGFKVILYFGDLASFLDLAVIIYMIFLLLGFSNLVITVLSIVYLAQKGIASLF
ncbi:MAG: hypothetical protein PWQ28_32 [Candidatus Woesearchaeota archaeon]|nr:hypothetical protein [Candidatus Woesearchaeota archaeon]MDK2908413.1 hypothetical protein [Candidatus Woesearchaeota archaeon]